MKKSGRIFLCVIQALWLAGCAALFGLSCFLVWYVFSHAAEVTGRADANDGWAVQLYLAFLASLPGGLGVKGFALWLYSDKSVTP